MLKKEHKEYILIYFSISYKKLYICSKCNH